MTDIRDIAGVMSTSASQVLGSELSRQAMALTGVAGTSVSQILSDELSKQAKPLTGVTGISVSQVLSDELSRQAKALTGIVSTSVSQILSDELSRQAKALTGVAGTSVSQILSDEFSRQAKALTGVAAISASQTLSDMLSSQVKALTSAADTSANSFWSDILNVQNVPLGVAIDYDWLEETSKCSAGEAEEIYETALDEIATKKDYHSLSFNAKNLVVFILCFILTDVVWDIAKGLATNELYARLTDANKILPSKSTPEIKAIARGKSAPEFDRSVIKGYRVVFSKGLYFRDEPTMKSEIITTLIRGTPLEVVDGSNRTWVQVAVTIDGEEELGWVSKRYTILVR